MRTHSIKQALLATSISTLFLSTLSPVLALAGGQGFVDTKTGQPLKIDAALFNTEQAKKFMSTGENPYIGNKEAIASGKKLYQLYSCTQCHGAQAQGQTAVGLTGPNFNNAKSATDKGMFEIIWAGTNAGMSGKGKGVMGANDGLTPDEALKVIAWVRSQGGSGSKQWDPAKAT